jgi:hypothetical protein
MVVVSSEQIINPHRNERAFILQAAQKELTIGNLLHRSVMSENTLVEMPQGVCGSVYVASHFNGRLVEN